MIHVTVADAVLVRHCLARGMVLEWALSIDCGTVVSVVVLLVVGLLYLLLSQAAIDECQSAIVNDGHVICWT